MEKGLTTIKADELIFSDMIEDDRVNTCLTLNDYDWMTYNLNTRFKTEALGRLHVLFEYFGSGVSRMYVLQDALVNSSSDGCFHTNMIHTKKYVYDFSSDLFAEHIKRFMEAHIRQWGGGLAFNGETEVLAFYNAVIEEGTLVEEPQNFPDREDFFW